MPNIIPIRDLRDTSRISEICNQSNEPIFITKNGYGDMVIMSLKVYEEIFEKMEIKNKVMEAMIQVKNGEVVDGKEALAELRKKYGK